MKKFVFYFRNGYSKIHEGITAQEAFDKAGYTGGMSKLDFHEELRVGAGPSWEWSEPLSKWVTKIKRKKYDLYYSDGTIQTAELSKDEIRSVANTAYGALSKPGVVFYTPHQEGGLPLYQWDSENERWIRKIPVGK